MARAVTTQQTAKRWKLMQALGALAALVGVCLVFAPSTMQAGGYLLAGGAGVFLAGRLAGWWFHA